MPRYAIVENGIVVNVAIATTPLDTNWIESATARRGDTWDGTTFSPPPPYVPDMVSRYQFATALKRAGTITAAEAKAFAGGNELPQLAIDAIATYTADQDTRDELEIKGLASVNVRRGDGLVGLLAGHLSMTPSEVDDLFRTAATIT